MTEANDPRPKPRYGEYADATPATETQVEPSTAAGDSIQPAAAPPVAQTAPSSGPLPGVPHNLGARSQPQQLQPQQAPAETAGPGHGEPYRSAAPDTQQRVQTQQPQPLQQAPQPIAPQPIAAQAQPVAQRPTAGRSVDRISTIILLVVGAYSGLNSAFNLMQFRNYLAQLASVFGVEDYVAPQSVATLGQIGAVSILALYAVTLIYSIQRLRARKLAFWVPLAAGAIAFVLWLAFSMIALAQSPELLQAMSQPDALQKLLGYVEAQGL